MRADDSLHDRELVERARTDPEAFAVLYRRYLPRIRAFAVRRAGNRLVADDITAAVFERAWTHLHRIDVPDHGIGPWLYRVASNEVSSHFRKTGRGRRAHDRLEQQVLPEPADPADELVVTLEVAAVREALATLADRHQEVISLRYFAGLSPQETAEVMGIGPPAVAAVLHRAIKALDRALQAQGYQFPDHIVRDPDPPGEQANTTQPTHNELDDTGR